jgi:hypothetical protein
MYPASSDSIVAFARGPIGPTGEVSNATLAAAIAALKGGVDPAGDTLAELYALILARATLDDIAAFSVSPTVPTLAPGNNSTKAANSAFVHQELINYALALTGGTLTGPLILNGDPSTALGAATRQYVDAVIQSISNKYSALCATTPGSPLPANTYANGSAGVGATLTGNANGALVVDGQSPAAGQYVLAKDEAAGAHNGLYFVTQPGDASHPYILTRAVDDDIAAEMTGAFCFVEQGTVNNKTGWLCGQAAITVGTTAIVFTQFSGAGTYTAGAMLSLTGSQFAVSDPELLALGGLTGAADRLPYFTGPGAALLATFTAFARTLIACADATAVKTALAIALADISDASANGRSLIAAANYAAMRALLSLGTAATKNTGSSVADPGTGALEMLLPIQTVTGAAKTFATSDLSWETRRSNAGSAMTDTFPASSTTGLANGTKIVVTNVDASGSVTITPGAGTTISGSGVVGPGRAIQYIYDLPNTIWRPTLNTGTALLGPNNLSDLSNAATARSNLGLGNVATQAAGTGLTNSGGNLNLQPAAAGAIGGVNSIAAVSHNWINAISTAGLPSLSQPSMSDIATGTAPAFTLGGNISGGGFGVDNAVIGGATPLAGTFTTLTANTSVSAPIIKASGALKFQSNGSTFAGSINTGQQWIIGSDNTAPAGPLLFVNKATSAGNQATTNGSVTANVSAHFVGSDGNSNNIVMDAYGNGGAPGVITRRAQGTQAAPTAVLSGDSLFAFVTLGYFGSGAYSAANWSSFGGLFASAATENWDASHQGQCWQFYTTANGTTSLNERVRIGSGLMVGTTTEPGIGNASIANALQVGSFTVATLPAGVTGRMVWCSNCRVFNGAGVQEGAAAGTGGLVTYNGSAWKIAGTNVTAVA